MIFPRNRLLFWVGAVILPFSLLAGIEPASVAISLSAMAVLLVVILFDAVRSRNALSGISVEAPAIARMSKDRDANLELKIRNPGLKARNLALGVALPPEIQSASEETWIALPAGAEWSRFHWACKPLSRGKFRTAWVYLEASSPLGFWAVRKTAHCRAIS